ncbi:MAG: helix-turn-helix domain-containing protein [Polyangiaceae bacterium]|nr:helix-turn-helix domain-containing protein [Polyangiaceae bacterium]
MRDLEDPPPHEPVEALAPRSVRHVIAVTGGRGGAGASTLAVNLGVYLAQLGRSVVLVDSDPVGAQLHHLLGMSLPEIGPPPEDSLVEELKPHDTPIPGLLLVPQGYSVGTSVPLRPGRKPRWARTLRQLEADHVILDLGAGTAPATLDLYLGADLGICVTTPDPASVEGLYRFLRAIFQRRLRRTLIKDRFKIRLVDRAQAELPPLPAPIEFIRTLARFDTQLAELGAAELSRLRPKLAVNNVRLRTDAELGASMTDMASRYLGVNLEHIGNVDGEDCVWLSAVRRLPLLIDTPTSKSARHIERIARRVQALMSTAAHSRTAEPISLLPAEPTLYDILLAHRSATDEELRRASRRQKEIFQAGSLSLTSLLSEERLRRELARIEEAHDTLLDPLRRRAYDISTLPEEPETEVTPNPARDAAMLAERDLLREELAHELTPQSQYHGALLRKIRESQGIELGDIASRTKISSAHLQALENDDFSALPALVYTRGFLREVAKFLALDPLQVSKTYLVRYRAWREARDDAGN